MEIHENGGSYSGRVKRNAMLNAYKRRFGPQNATKKMSHLKSSRAAPLKIRTKLKSDEESEDESGEHEICTPKPRSSSSSGSGLNAFFDTMTHNEQEKSSSMFARAVYVTGCALSKFEHRIWQEFFKHLRPSFKLPTRHILSTNILGKEYKLMERLVNENIQTAEICCLQMDGWSNIRNEAIFNFIITTPLPLFVASTNVSVTPHTGDFIATQIETILLEHGIQKFFALIGDNVRNVQNGFKILVSKYPHLTGLSCATHSAHFLCGSIMKCPSVKSFFNNIVNIIEKIKKCQILSGIFMEIKKKDQSSSMLQLPWNTQWGSCLYTSESVLKSKTALQQLAIDERTSHIWRKNENKELHMNIFENNLNTEAEFHENGNENLDYDLEENIKINDYYENIEVEETFLGNGLETVCACTDSSFISYLSLDEDMSHLDDINFNTNHYQQQQIIENIYIMLPVGLPEIVYFLIF